MTSKLKLLAIAAAMAAGTSSVAMAQVCPAGTAWNGATCAAAPGYVYAPSNPVSGAAAGGAAGAATGAATAGPGGAVGGTANMVSGAPVYATGSSTPPAPVAACPPGSVLYAERCYPAR